MPKSLKPVRIGCGNMAAISCTGASPRNRYIGFCNELPAVSSSASSVPSLSSNCATSHALVEPQAAGYAVGHVQLGEHRHPSVDGLAHAFGDLAREPAAVLDRAAPLVVAAIELRAQELARQVAVPEVELDCVAASVGNPSRGRHEIIA